MAPPKLSAGWLIDGALGALELGLQIGLLSGAGIAAVFGQFLLALLILAIASGLLLRIWRRKRAKTKS